MNRFKQSSCNAVISRCLKNFCNFASILQYIPLSWNCGKNFEFSVFHFKWFLFKSQIHYTVLLGNGRIHSFVLTLSNVVTLDFENENVVSTLFNAVHINVGINNVGSTWLMLSVPTLIYITLCQRWFDVVLRWHFVLT